MWTNIQQPRKENSHKICQWISNEHYKSIKGSVWCTFISMMHQKSYADCDKWTNYQRFYGEILSYGPFLVFHNLNFFRRSFLLCVISIKMHVFRGIKQPLKKRIEKSTVDVFLMGFLGFFGCCFASSPGRTSGIWRSTTSEYPGNLASGPSLIGIRKRWEQTMDAH